MSAHKTHAPHNEAGHTANEQRIEMLRTAMGAVIANALADRDVTDVMLNPDGMLWVQRLHDGSEPLGVKLSPLEGERIIRLIAAHVNAEVHAGKPLLSAELPETGERFNAALPPVVSGPAFCIRKHAPGVIDLDEYVTDGILSAAQASFLRSCVYQKKNILVAGGPGSGRTTLVNAILKEIATTGNHVVTLQNTLELQCSSLNHIAVCASPRVVTMRELTLRTLRYVPDWIVVGDIRADEAFDLVRAWSTRHTCGVATIRSGSAHDALVRLEHLILKVALAAVRPMIAEAINVIVFLAGRGRTRRVEEIVRVTGLTCDGYALDRTLSEEHI
jgi:type IV secretion system protein TrbB